MFGSVRRSTLAFAACSLVLIAIKLLFDHYPGEFPGRDQASAFTWPVIGAIWLAALLGLFAERSIGFPDAFADMKGERRGLILAVATGLAYGALTVVQDIVTGGSTVPVEEWPHLPLPWAVPFYTFGAIFLEFLLRLGALCLLVWFVHVLILRRRWLLPVFWIANLIVSFYEIMPMTMADVAAGDWGAVALTPLWPLYWTNLFEGWLLLRHGWFAPIIFRLAFYLVWHVGYGGLGPF
ncbi:MAG TPA: hypothetical protein VEC11_16915 [Allosphingosinicella sp.]|nr:hypothetical protein [Allosphingosinicella sp.]